MKTQEKLNMTMLCDFYELTMGNGYFKNGYKDRITYFDVFFRRVPDGGGFAIAAGLEQLIEYIENLHFSPEDIAYLRGRKLFDEEFLTYLENFRFTGDIYAIPEGTPVFPREPLVTVRAPAIEAQLIETFTLLTVNHQSLIATKANRIVRAARGRTVLEFGSRRAQGVDAAVDGARAAYIGGCKGTACTLTDQLYGVPAGGTMAHSWVQMFPSEYEAFKAYCETYPENPTLLVDTYNTLKSGIPNAIRVFNEVLKPRGLTKCGIRLDSGDMTYLTKKAQEKRRLSIPVVAVCTIFGLGAASAGIDLFREGKTLSGVMAVLLLAALFTPAVRTFAHYRRSAGARRIAGTLLATPEESLTFDQLQTTLSSAKAPQKLRALVSGGYLQNLQINADERTVKLYTPEYEYVQWVCSGCGAKNRERKGSAMRCKYCDQPRAK